jgi:L,D-transpeptidase ErfK/SrfK
MIFSRLHLSALTLGLLLGTSPVPAQAEGMQLAFLKFPSRAEKQEEKAAEDAAPPAESEKEEKDSKADAKKADAKKAESKKADAKKASVAPEPSAKPAKSEPFTPYDKDWVGTMKTHIATYDDMFVELARKYNVGYVELRSANQHLDPWIPGEGKKVVIPTMHLLPQAERRGVVINLAEMRMYVFKTPGKAPLTYPIGIGREGLQTPVGETTIVRKKDGPNWRPTARMREENPALPVTVGPGPDNPLGTHAMYLGWPEYLIHGTDKPYSIGRRLSSGCIRMYPEDIIKAFGLVPVGMGVHVVDQSVKAGWVGDKFFVEASPTTEQVDRMEIDGGLPGYVFSNDDMAVIMKVAGDHANDLDWSVVRRVVRERRGYPIEVFRKPDPVKQVAAEADVTATDQGTSKDDVKKSETDDKASADKAQDEVTKVAEVDEKASAETDAEKKDGADADKETANP